MKFIRIENDVVTDVIDLPEDVALEDAIHVDLAVDYVVAPHEVEAGWIRTGNLFEPPANGASVNDLKAAKIAALSVACEAAITGGFASDALGEEHQYPSDIKAQINLMGSVTDSIMPGISAAWTTPFWVCDTAGVWTWKMHNAAQIQQAGRDGKAHVVSCQTLLAELTAAVLAAATAEAVASVEWPETTSA